MRNQSPWFYTGIIALFLSSSTFAKTPFGMAGCGLGSIAMGPKGSQVSAATTNGTSSNQISGISSGTSNCVEPNEAVAEAAQKNFIQQNFATLNKEIAQGDGNTLKAFSDTFGCSQEAYPSFAQELQKSYDEIFAAPGSLAALDVIVDELQTNDTAVKGCEFLF